MKFVLIFLAVVIAAIVVMWCLCVAVEALLKTFPSRKD